ncbi:hypothetical protein B9Q12_03440 [Candidatus Marsarchaeota G2 archaeon ECH_B_SAG-G06]|uniref:Ferritin/DPS domain-containing protein n=1 Tax=Candidatus Marsarchaeota G2 archaeon ECH_B_SAG-G06 TaxID=1978166 RepID=A0A2R6BZ77_9ARCH|nr:MAG: hypothetical protein B9Q12_03440 [Candidatus Marsarchaeota G2 archaeon ECH_B_SAG-G06]
MNYIFINKIIEQLNRAVADSYILYLNYKRYHWNVSGALFRELHLLFDEHAKRMLETVDDFAERVKALGGDAIGAVNEVIELSDVKSAKSGMSAREMIEQAIQNHEKLIARFKQAIKLCESANDPGSMDLFTRHIQLHEKLRWFLKEHLEKDSLLDS